MQGTPRKDRLLDPNTILEQEPTSHQPFFANTSKPFTRWWWLRREWSDLMAFSKQYADQIGLGCDFTFGSCWPFGGLCVQPQDAAQTFDGLSNQRLRGSWGGRARLPKYPVQPP